MAEKKYCVIRTDLMSGTKQPADLVSFRFYDDAGELAEVENGVIVIVMLDWMRYVIEGGERPHYKFI